MDKDYLKKFGENLKKLRKEKSLTQDDISVQGISRQMVSLVELGLTDISLTKIKAIADNMNIEVKDLFNFE